MIQEAIIFAVVITAAAGFRIYQVKEQNFQPNFNHLSVNHLAKGTGDRTLTRVEASQSSMDGTKSGEYTIVDVGKLNRNDLSSPPAAFNPPHYSPVQGGQFYGCQDAPGGLGVPRSLAPNGSLLLRNTNVPLYGNPGGQTIVSLEPVDDNIYLMQQTCGGETRVFLARKHNNPPDGSGVSGVPGTSETRGVQGSHLVPGILSSSNETTESDAGLLNQLIYESKFPANASCEPGKEFQHYCNNCTCSISGKGANCTDLICCPGAWNQNGSLKVERQPYQQYITLKNGKYNGKWLAADGSEIQPVAVVGHIKIHEDEIAADGSKRGHNTVVAYVKSNIGSDSTNGTASPPLAATANSPFNGCMVPPIWYSSDGITNARLQIIGDVSPCASSFSLKEPINLAYFVVDPVTPVSGTITSPGLAGQMIDIIGKVVSSGKQISVEEYLREQHQLVGFVQTQRLTSLSGCTNQQPVTYQMSHPCYCQHCAHQHYFYH